MPRLTAARGLITSSNEVSRPDGALTRADNVIIDYDNVIQPRRGFKEYSQLLATPPKQLFTYKSTILAHYGTNLSFDLSNSGTFTNFSGSYSELVTGLRIKALEASGNFYFTTNEGVKKLSVRNVSDLPTASIINSGAAEATDLSGKVIPDPAGFLPAQSKVGYRLLFGYKDANNNLLRGAATSRVLLTNYSQDINMSEIFTINVLSYSTIVGGSYLLFNTTDTGYFLWFNKSGTDVAPITADTLDRQGIEIDISSTGITANEDVAAIIGNVISSQVSGVSVEISTAEVQVTVNEAGNVTDPSQGDITDTIIKVTKTFDGSITTGTTAKAELNFTIPPDVDETYFYQIYRTGVVTVSPGVTLSDIDPGDEHQFVFEAPVTAADLLAGEITVTDITPEAFRQVGEYLYSNGITGAGITQSNSRPPIAQDIATFRNSTFYSNTKDFHTITFSMLSVDDFVSGVTKFYVGRGAKAVEYTFVGVAEVTDITVVAPTGTTESSYIEINSANDEREYYLWIDKGAGVDPAITGKIGVRMPLELYPDTIAGSKQALIDSLLTIGDFTAVDYNLDTVRITCTDTGTVVNPVNSGTGWTVAVSTEGTGENTATRQVLLSQSSSVGISIDLTARSLVRVINKDTLSPVTATYLSGVDDLPGKILLKAKTLEDIDFYLAVSDQSLVAEFSPELPVEHTITSINNVTKVFTTGTNHNLFAGDEIYINDNPGSTPTEFGGVYKVLTTPSVTEFTVVGGVSIDQPVITGTVFKTTAASDNNEVPNRVYYSKLNQPEAVPAVNYIDIGSKDKQILRILPLRDNLFVLKDDGIFIITGSGPGSFSSRLLDNSAIVTAPDSAVVLNNLIYCLSTQGVISISDSGVSIISRQIEDQIKKVTTFNYNYKYTSFGVSYESDRAYLLWLPSLKSDTVATQCFRYSTITNSWTRWTMSNTCGIVNYLGDDRMYLGGNGRQYVLQERKNNERQDHADRDFTRNLGTASINEDRMSISSTVDVEVGDVVTQDQYVTIALINRMLKKLDADPGTTNKDYYSLFQVSPGAHLGNALLDIVTHLNTDVTLAGTFTVPSGSITLAALKTDYDTMINELNVISSGTSYKDYKLAVDLLVYEVEITEMTKGSNTVTVDRLTNFIQGDIQIYKAIKTEVEYAPQHFGKPEAFKQISEGTIIFDQCTISRASIGYASDRSLEFVDIKFKLDGPGFWGSFIWIDTPWGGNSNERSQRTLIPQTKARCRYLHVRFKHSVARQQYKLLGISLEPREFSTRAYR